jgi:hypothetical protein
MGWPCLGLRAKVMREIMSCYDLTTYAYVLASKPHNPCKSDKTHRGVPARRNTAHRSGAVHRHP